MKQTMSPPLHGAPQTRKRRLRLRGVSTLLLLLSLFAGGLVAQSPVTSLEAGKFLHLRLTNYSISAWNAQNGENRAWDSNTGLELLYEKVGDAGRGTRYLVGWRSDQYHRATQEADQSKYSYDRNSHNFRLGIGKSQTGRYKRLVLRGGIDTYLQFAPGSRVSAVVLDSAGTHVSSEKSSGAPSFLAAARPFVGLGVQLSERLALGIEYNVTLGVEAKIGTDRYDYTFPSLGQVVNEAKILNFSLFAYPNGFLPFVTLSYRF